LRAIQREGFSLLKRKQKVIFNIDRHRSGRRRFSVYLFCSADLRADDIRPYGKSNGKTINGRVHR
ncbi:MAG: hypothetical protein II254_02140, partial [Oscillospiraceae bacterium]|nr:hypothetical protein [Oscillospiraceae bacterium]